MKREWLKKTVSLLMAMILLLMPFSSLAASAAELEGDGLTVPAGMTEKNWMGYLPNTADLATVTLPGTANSGAQEMMTLNYMAVLQSLVDQLKLTDSDLVQETILTMLEEAINAAAPELEKINIPLNCIAQCQSLSIPEQLDSGVRLLDIRCSEFREGGELILTNGGIKCVHKEKKEDEVAKNPNLELKDDGAIVYTGGDATNADMAAAVDAANQSLTFDAVLKQAKQFVTDNPTETVVMVVSGEPFFFPKPSDDCNIFVKVIWETLRYVVEQVYKEIVLTLGDLDKIDDWAEADLEKMLDDYAYGGDDKEGSDPQIISVFDDRAPYPTVGEARGKVVLVNKKDLTDTDFGAAQTSGDAQIKLTEKWGKIESYLNNVGKQNYEGDTDKIRGDKLCPAVADTTCFGTMTEFMLNGAIAFAKNYLLKKDETEPDPEKAAKTASAIAAAKEYTDPITDDEEKAAFMTAMRAAGLSEDPGSDVIKDLIGEVVKAILPDEAQDIWDKMKEEDSATSAIAEGMNALLWTALSHIESGHYAGWMFVNYVKGTVEVPEKAPIQKLTYLLNEFDFNRNGKSVDYISELVIAYDPDMNTAVSKLKEGGYTVVSDSGGNPVNMNEIGNSFAIKDIRNWTSTPTINGKQAKSPFAVAMGYKTAKDPKDAVTGMFWTYRDDDGAAVADADKKIIDKYNYQLVKKACAEFTHTDIKNDCGYADFNISTKETNDIVNLYYSKDARLGERFTAGTLEAAQTYYKTIKDPNTGKTYPQADRDKADARVKENLKKGYRMPEDRDGKYFCSNQTRAFNDVYLMANSVFPDFNHSREKTTQSKVVFAGRKIADAKANPGGITVSGLDAVAGTFGEDVTMRVEPQKDTDSPEQAAIKQAAGKDRKFEFFDLTLLKEKDGGATDIGGINDQLLTIALPFDFTGVDIDSIMVHRYHNGSVETLKRNPAEGEEGFTVDAEAGAVTIRAFRFSTYAVSYSEAADDETAGAQSVNTGIAGDDSGLTAALAALVTALCLAAVFVIGRRTGAKQSE